MAAREEKPHHLPLTIYKKKAGKRFNFVIDGISREKYERLRVQ